jgi:hypothetical protein
VALRGESDLGRKCFESARFARTDVRFVERVP